MAGTGIRVTELNDPAAVSRQEQIALAQLTLLMRIYDVQMALLTEINEDAANLVYSHHENGHSYNPPIYLVDVAETPEGSVEADADEPSS